MSFVSEGPPLPDLPDQYQTVIEANIVDRGKTVTGYEYFDRPGNQATLQMRMDDQLFSLIYDYNHNQLFYAYSSNRTICDKYCLLCCAHTSLESKNYFLVVSIVVKTVYLYLC